ncbi:nucleoside-diphosphate-sugar epimerase [Candidatus Scalindua japonica]|uniref:UDP-glucuronate decarboxylase n=1 Tax=Candidatus Scalindua japonica TaxID=1284222 RepID=A0A286TWW5_9BACT|nr:GDP-mannose 4,6-dehydratase [Candidatus Scalindua japonica]GAX60364.1 nucleoside-diphosphate-sugar epimerase [Candidatus Scalindua japonica]
MISNKKTSSKLRALVTGGSGFVGSHLAERLLEYGYQVTIIDDLSTGSFENIAHLTERPDFNFAIDSITNNVVVDRLVSECDVIFHLAAAVGVKLIVEKPVHTIETNVLGTESILKAAQRYRVKVLLASTSEVYGKGNGIPFNEEDDVVLGATTRSRWSYATSKMLDEFLALAYYKEKGLPVVIFRLFNTVGPRQTGRYGMVIPRFVQQALQGKSLTVYGNGKQSRCFMHIHDAVNAILQLTMCPEAIGGVFNIGSTEEITISNLAHRTLAAINKHRTSYTTRDTESMENSEQIKFIPYEQAYNSGFEDMHQRVPDISKIQSATGWMPEKHLDNILMDVIESVNSPGEEAILLESNNNNVCTL